MLHKIVNFCIGLLFCLTSTHAFSQSDTTATISTSRIVMQQADSMGYYYVKNDFKHLMKYQHPGMVKLLGGEESLMKTLKDNVNKGIFTLSAFNDAPSTIIVSDSIMQCTLQQTMVMKVGNTKIEYISTLVCVSYNNGKNWFFINASGSPVSVIKEVFPEMSSDLVIQEQISRKVE